MNAETIARHAWDVAAESGWHPQLTEVHATGRVGETWLQPTWPGGDAKVLLGDYVTRPECRWLVLVSDCTITRANGQHAPGHLVVVLERDTHMPVVLAGDQAPARCDTLGGELIETMRASFSTHTTREETR